jgi:hypothetical protein
MTGLSESEEYTLLVPIVDHRIYSSLTLAPDKRVELKEFRAWCMIDVDIFG